MLVSIILLILLTSKKWDSCHWCQAKCSVYSSLEWFECVLWPRPPLTCHLGFNYGSNVCKIEEWLPFPCKKLLRVVALFWKKRENTRLKKTLQRSPKCFQVENSLIVLQNSGTLGHTCVNWHLKKAWKETVYQNLALWITGQLGYHCCTFI